MKQLYNPKRHFAAPEIVIWLTGAPTSVPTGVIVTWRDAAHFEARHVKHLLEDIVNKPGAWLSINWDFRRSKESPCFWLKCIRCFIGLGIYLDREEGVQVGVDKGDLYL